MKCKKLWNKEQSVKLAIFAAELLISDFESVNQSDSRPRMAIDAAKGWLKNKIEPCENMTYSDWYEVDGIKKIMQAIDASGNALDDAELHRTYASLNNASMETIGEYYRARNAASVAMNAAQAAAEKTENGAAIYAGYACGVEGIAKKCRNFAIGLM